MTDRTTIDGRPDPDALLAEISKEEKKAARGKLKVFFGASPGVGKTYAMLEEGRARAAEGMDVVVGYAEPHARPETEAILLGMELLPYLYVEYRNVRLKEFDLDGALRRKPALVLVDELAHTNAPGMRHPKRYLDVMELLDAGISVYTTLNVQHLESLNDVVQRITGIVVRETLPDSILEQADEVELIDTSPDELLERLNEGKIYHPEMAERATRNFFSKGNLIALRELALRRTAERVDAQMEDFRRENRVDELWPAVERLLVCVSPSPLSMRLVRSCKRLATGVRAEWIAAFVETPAQSQMRHEDRERVVQTLRLAQQLGAETVTLSGENIAEELITYARSRNVTKIVIGKPEQSRWKDIFRGSLVDELIRRSGPIDIYVIRGQGEALPAIHAAPAPAAIVPQAYLLVLAHVAAATALAWVLERIFKPANAPANQVMIYLLGVVSVATRLGRRPAIVAAVLSVLTFDYFFVEPRYSFSVADTQYVVTFAVMLLIALVISALTNRVRAVAQTARQRERRTAALLALSRELAATRELEKILAASVRQIAEVFDAQVVLLMPDADSRLAVAASRLGGFSMDEKEMSVARWVLDHDQLAGQGTTTLPGSAATYLPMIASQGAVGVLGVAPAQPTTLHDPEQLRLLEAFANQSAAAIERARLAADARSAWERVEAEFLRNTLLSSVSHDLRTPLAAIEGAASSLVEAGQSLNDEVRRELAETIYDESERMDRLVNNLLDMTRLESGGLHLKKEWQPIQEVIGSALHHLSRRLKGRDVKVELAPDLPLAQFDAISIEQVLVNLLDNAIECTPPATPIELCATPVQGAIAIEVNDRGPGLPPGTQEKIFQKFFSARPDGNVDHGRRGMGLGLSICRGIIEAHGGTISGGNRSGGGATFRFTLPVDGVPPALKAES